MSSQYGRWNFDGAPFTPGFSERVSTALTPYGPDGENSFEKDGVLWLHQAFHTTTESLNERQPHVLPDGTVLSWDGRLDNRKELIAELNGGLSQSNTDLSIVVVAYEHWSTGCFRKLRGDWAFAAWSPRERSLVLAVDIVGVRHLYYSTAHDHIAWSSIFDPLVLFADKPLGFEEEYFAGLYASFPAAHLTPCTGIHRVPPGCFVTLTPEKRRVMRYGDFDGSKKIRYRTDTEYEEHFRTVFGEAVRRRLRSQFPVVAELSGGMDSSSIVCMADHVEHAANVETISYYSDIEPHWDEKPYFEEVERLRGHVGLHINVDPKKSASLAEDPNQITFSPGSSLAGDEMIDHMRHLGSRVVLSGIGGDEAMGGVPTPIPEIEDLLVRGRWKTMARQLQAWALIQRRPWFHLLWEVGIQFLPPSLSRLPKHRHVVDWLSHAFVRRNSRAFLGYERRRKIFGPLPTFQENLSALETLRRQLGCVALHPGYPFEKRYPFLDQDLLAFIYAIPREQLVRPGQRRSLMRRAMRGIVPDAVLNRKRKAFVSRSPLEAIAERYPALADRSDGMISGGLGMVVPEAFAHAIKNALEGKQVPIVPMLRTIAIEEWLRALSANGLLNGSRIRVPFDSETMTKPNIEVSNTGPDAKRLEA